MITLPEWVIQSIVGAILGLSGMFIAGFIWIIRLGSRVSALEKESAVVKQQVVDNTLTMTAAVEKLNTALSSAREQALMTFVPDSRFQKLETQLDEVQLTLAELVGSLQSLPKPQRRRAKKPSSQDEA